MKVFSWLIESEDWTQAWDHWPGDALVLADRFDEVVCCKRKDCPEPGWDQGHVFSESWHLSWRRLGDRYRVVLAAEDLLSETETWGDATPIRDLSGIVPEPGEALLWGVKSYRDDPYWIELYIPHLMEPLHHDKNRRYPLRHHPNEHAIPPVGQAACRLLQYETYRDKDSGAVMYHRFTGIVYAASKDDGSEYSLSERVS